MYRDSIWFWIIAFICLTCFYSRAQQQDSVTRPERSALKINLFQLVDGELRILLEKPIKGRSSFEFTGSYYFNYSLFESYKGERLFDNRTGFKLGIAWRHYFQKETHLYLGPVLFYKYMSYENVISNVAEGGGSIPYYFFHENFGSSADYKKQILDLHLEFGNRICERNGWFIEMYFGIGGRLSYLIRDSRYKGYTIKPSIPVGLLLAVKM